MEHFTNPKYVGDMKDANAIGEEGNIRCGDILKIFLKIEGEIIKKASFLTYGCIAALASSDVLCDLAKGKKVDEALKIKAKDIANELGGLPAIKHHCSINA